MHEPACILKEIGRPRANEVTESAIDPLMPRVIKTEWLSGRLHCGYQLLDWAMRRGYDSLPAGVNLAK